MKNLRSINLRSIGLRFIGLQSIGLQLIATGILFSSSAAVWAAANLSGSYISDNNCQVQIDALDMPADYADALYLIKSDGNASCEWSGVGVAKRTHVQAGMVSGSVQGFVELNWLYGPAGAKVEATFYGMDGKINNKEVLTRQ